MAKSIADVLTIAQGGEFNMFADGGLGSEMWRAVKGAIQSGRPVDQYYAQPLRELIEFTMVEAGTDPEDAARILSEFDESVSLSGTDEAGSQRAKELWKGARKKQNPRAFRASAGANELNAGEKARLQNLIQKKGDALAGKGPDLTSEQVDELARLEARASQPKVVNTGTNIVTGKEIDYAENARAERRVDEGQGRNEDGTRKAREVTLKSRDAAHKIFNVENPKGKMLPDRVGRSATNESGILRARYEEALRNGDPNPLQSTLEWAKGKGSGVRKKTVKAVEDKIRDAVGFQGIYKNGVLAPGIESELKGSYAETANQRRLYSEGVGANFRQAEFTNPRTSLTPSPPRIQPSHGATGRIAEVIGSGLFPGEIPDIKNDKALSRLIPKQRRLAAGMVAPGLTMPGPVSVLPTGRPSFPVTSKDLLSQAAYASSVVPPNLADAEFSGTTATGKWKNPTFNTIQGRRQLGPKRSTMGAATNPLLASMAEPLLASRGVSPAGASSVPALSQYETAKIRSELLGGPMPRKPIDPQKFFAGYPGAEDFKPIYNTSVTKSSLEKAKEVSSASGSGGTKRLRDTISGGSAAPPPPPGGGSVPPGGGAAPPPGGRSSGSGGGRKYPVIPWTAPTQAAASAATSGGLKNTLGKFLKGASRYAWPALGVLTGYEILRGMFGGDDPQVSGDARTNAVMQNMQNAFLAAANEGGLMPTMAQSYGNLANTALQGRLQAILQNPEVSYADIDPISASSLSSGGGPMPRATNPALAQLMSGELDLNPENQGIRDPTQGFLSAYLGSNAAMVTPEPAGYQPMPQMPQMEEPGLGDLLRGGWREFTGGNEFLNSPIQSTDRAIGSMAQGMIDNEAMEVQNELSGMTPGSQEYMTKVAALQRRGYSPKAIRAVMGGM